MDVNFQDLLVIVPFAVTAAIGPTWIGRALGFFVPGVASDEDVAADASLLDLESSEREDWISLLRLSPTFIVFGCCFSFFSFFFSKPEPEVRSLLLFSGVVDKEHLGKKEIGGKLLVREGSVPMRETEEIKRLLLRELSKRYLIENILVLTK